MQKCPVFIFTSQVGLENLLKFQLLKFPLNVKVVLYRRILTCKSQQI